MADPTPSAAHGVGAGPADRAARRYRCRTCGNVTRFTVTAMRRTRAFHHYTLGGELTVEDEEVLDDVVESVTCRWCGPASADAVEELRESEV